MIEPNGPLPAGVYWRRRAFAVGASVLAVVVLAWVVGGFVGAEDDHPVRGTASSRDVTGAGASSAPPSSRSSSAPSSDASTTAPTTSATAPTTAPTTAPPAASPSATPTGRPITTAPPGQPKACPDAAIRVTVQTDQPSYRVGQRPRLRLLVANVGKDPCVREVSRELRELLIFTAGGKRLWSSNDCYRPPGTEKRVLTPGSPLVFQLRWAGRTSAPGCPLDRTTVPAGTYRVIGKLGQLTGKPIPLTLTP